MTGNPWELDWSQAAPAQPAQAGMTPAAMPKPQAAPAQPHPVAGNPWEQDWSKAAPAERAEPQGFLDKMSRGIGDLYTAIRGGWEGTTQGTEGATRDPRGNFLRPLVGEPDVGVDEQGRERTVVKTQAGDYIAYDPKQHVWLRDAPTGKVLIFSRTPQTEQGPLVGLGRIVMEGAAAGPVAGIQRAAGVTPRAATVTQRATQATADVDAASRLGVRLPGFVLNEGPTASVAKQLSEIPLIGGPVRRSLYEGLEGTRNATDRIANALAPAQTFDTTGITLQRGLDRFRTARLQDLEPATVQGLGIEPRVTIPRPAALDGAALARAERADPIRQQIGGGTALTSRGVQVPASPQTGAPQVIRRGVADLSDAELGTVLRTPAGDTSFATRQEALYESAHRRLPAIMRVNNSRDPLQVGSPNSAVVARALLQHEESSAISGGVLAGRFGPLVQQLMNSHRTFTLDALRAARTEVGRALANFGMYDARLDRTQLRQLYGAISRDIERAYQDIANRAFLGTQRSNNAANYVTPDMARGADRALYEFRRADRYTRMGMDRMDRFMTIVRADKPEAAAQRLLAAAREGGRGNIELLGTARAALRPEEWADFSGLVLSRMGQPLPSARGMTQDLGFSVATFITNWERMEPRARAMLFGAGAQAQAVNDLVRVVRRFAEVEALTNTSRSATNAINVTSLMGAGSAAGLAWLGNLDAMLTGGLAAGSGYLASVMLSRPAYTRWMTQYLQLRAQIATNQQAISRIRAHVVRLQQLATRDPELARALGGPSLSRAKDDQKQEDQPK